MEELPLRKTKNAIFARVCTLPLGPLRQRRFPLASEASAVTGVDAGGPAGRRKDSREHTARARLRAGERDGERESFGERGVRKDAVTPATDESVSSFLFGETSMRANRAARNGGSF